MPDQMMRITGGRPSKDEDLNEDKDPSEDEDLSEDEGLSEDEDESRQFNHG